MLTLDQLFSYLEENAPGNECRSRGGWDFERVDPSDARQMMITRWGLHRDGNCTPLGKDILTKEVNEYGQRVMYVNFRHPDTHFLSDNQTIYRITETHES